MSQVGALSIAITADGSQATRELGHVDNRVQKSSKNLTKSMATWAKWGAAAAAAAVAAAAALTKMAMSSIDDLAKTSRSIDGTIDGLRGLRIAAGDAGIGASELDSSVQVLNQRLGEAMRGSGAAKDSLDRLGLSAEELSRMDVDERMATIADRMQAMGMSSAQAGDELRQLGIRNREMVLLMTQGGDAIRDARGEVDSLGLSLSEVDAAKVEQANDAMSRIGMMLGSLFENLAVQFAPLLTAIAERFTSVASEAGGFGSIATKAFDAVVKAIGITANVISGLIRGVKTLGNAFVIMANGATAVFAKIAETIAKAFDWVISMVIEGINSVIRQLNRLPKVDIDEIADPQLAANTAQLFSATGDAARENMESAWDAIGDTWSKPFPSVAIDQFVADSREAAEQAAQAVVDGQQRAAEAVGDSPVFRFSEEENQKFLDSLMERFATEAELYEMKYADELQQLREAKEQELLTEEEYIHRREQLAGEHADRMADIQEMERRQRIGIMSDMMKNLTGLMNTGSRKLFEIGKAAAIANALISGREAVVSSYAAGARIGGPPVGAAFAGTAAAATAAQISQIRSSSFSGGPNPNTFAGGVGAVRTTDVGGAAGGGQPAQRVDIRLSGGGSRFSRDEVIDLISQINGAVGDGVNIDFGG
jgi:hypothetical protein